MTDSTEHPQTPDRTTANQVQTLRQRQRLSQRQLAERLSELGAPFTQAAVARLESGRTRNLSISDLFALAAALNVAPVHLLANSFDQNDVPIVGQTKLSPRHARDWIRGHRPLPDSDEHAYAEQVAAEEHDIYRTLPALYLLKAWISDLEEATTAGDLAYGEHALNVIQEQVQRLQRDLQLQPQLWQQRAAIAHR